jgi:uncharacterized membrane protein YbhN (UPF0104 family)
MSRPAAKLMTWGQGLLGLVILAIAAFVLVRQLQGLELAHLRAAWRATPTGAIAWALLFTALSFVCLAAFEWVSVRRMAPGRIPDIAALRTGAVSHALANLLGFHAITGAALRLHAYRRFGLGAGDVARITGTVLGCIATGITAVAVGALAWLHPVPAAFAAMGLVVAAYAVIAALRSGREWPRAAAIASAVRGLGWVPLLGFIEMAAAIAALYVLLPAAALPSPAAFALLYIGVMLVGIASHVPSGLGVFEAGFLAALPAAYSAEVLAAVLLFRVIYNLGPFVLAMGVLGVGAVRRGSG